MKHKLLGETLIDLSLNPGDTVTILFDGEEIVSTMVDSYLYVNAASIYEIEDGLGYKKAIVGCFGERENESISI